MRIFNKINITDSSLFKITSNYSLFIRFIFEISLIILNILLSNKSMHNDQILSLHQKFSSEHLNSSTQKIDKENISQVSKSGSQIHIPDELIHNGKYIISFLLTGLGVSGQYSNRSRKSHNEPYSETKNYQSGLRDLTEYIFADNNSSIYYTENLEEPRSHSGFDSGIKIDPLGEVKDFVTPISKSVVSSYASEPRSLENSSRVNSTIEKYKTGDIDMSDDKSILLSEKDLLSNGVIIDEVLLHEGKPFIVMSVKNDIPHQKRNEMSNTTYTDNTSWTSVSKRRGDSLIFSQCQEEIKKSNIQIIGMRGLKNEVSDFVNSISQHLHSSEEHKETENMEKITLNETFELKENKKTLVKENEKQFNDLFRKKMYTSIGNTEEDEEYKRKKEELALLNKRILEETADLEQSSEPSQYQPLFKSTN